MVPSNASPSEAQRPHEPQASQKFGKTRRHRRPKSKHQEIRAESPPAGASTSVSAEQLKSWPWVSITEPPTTKHPPVFTKDGRCVLPLLNAFRSSDFVSNFKLLFLHRRFQREDIFYFYWARCIDPFRKTRYRKPHKCYNICHLKSPQRVPAYHRLPGWTYKSLGFVGWGSAADHWRGEPGVPHCCS